jgi:hypothetical protein
MALEAGSNCDSPLACQDLLGRSLLLRTISQLQSEGVDPITVVANETLMKQVPNLPVEAIEISLARRPATVWLAANRAIANHAESGIEQVLLVGLNAYREFDLSALLEFHHSRMHPVTRVFDSRGKLDFWVIDAAHYKRAGILGDSTFPSDKRLETVPYYVSGYVKRLRDARDFRALAVDGLLHRCNLKPEGTEVRPGVWIGEGARVQRRSRIVAPAYVGSSTRVEEDTLITRCSVVERDCHIAYGTVVEDCSILSETYAGACLDFSHAVVQGRLFLDLRRNVKVTIDDPVLVDHAPARSSRSSHKTLGFSLGSFYGLRRGSKGQPQLVT